MAVLRIFAEQKSYSAPRRGQPPLRSTPRRRWRAEGWLLRSGEQDMRTKWACPSAAVSGVQIWS